MTTYLIKDSKGSSIKELFYLSIFAGPKFIYILKVLLDYPIKLINRVYVYFAIFYALMLIFKVIFCNIIRKQEIIKI